MRKRIVKRYILKERRGLIISNVKRFSKEDFNNGEIVIDLTKEFTLDDLITTKCRFLIFDEKSRNISSNFKIVDNYRILISEKAFDGYVEYFEENEAFEINKQKLYEVDFEEITSIFQLQILIEFLFKELKIKIGEDNDYYKILKDVLKEVE